MITPTHTQPQEASLLFQPWTSESLQEIFAPGRGLKVLLEGRHAWQRHAVRHAVILAVGDGEMTLSQPEPALPPPLLGLALEITALGGEARGHRQRYAYVSSILDALPAYPATQGPMPAVVVMYPRPEDIYPTNLRKVRRYPVAPDTPLQLWLEDRRLNLLDISHKGLRFSNGEDLAGCRPGDEMKLSLVIHDEPQKVHGRVAAVTPGPQGREISLELGILPLDAWTSLLEALQELEHGAATQGTRA